MCAKFNPDYFYDFSYVERQDDVFFYLDMAKKYGQKGILEIGCGTGRVLLRTAELGINIDGIDPNKRRIQQCKKSLKEILASSKNLSCSVSANIIQNYKTDKKYSLATMPFRVFQHLLTPEEQEDTIRCVHNNLTDKGVFVFDIFNPDIKMLASDTYLQEFGEEHFVANNGLKFTRKDRVIERDYFKQIQSSEEIFEFILNGKNKKIIDKYTTRYSFKSEIENMLKHTGFKILNVYGNFDKSGFGKTQYPGDLIFVAQKIK